MTTARDAILAAWKPLFELQHIDIRLILERYAEEMARVAVQVVCPTEGERMVPRFERAGYGDPQEFMRLAQEAQAAVDVARVQFEQAMRRAQRDFA